MHQLDYIRNAPRSIIAILIGLVDPVGVVTDNKNPEGYGCDVDGFALQQPSSHTTLPAPRNASTSFYDLLTSSTPHRARPARACSASPLRRWTAPARIPPIEPSVA